MVTAAIVCGVIFVSGVVGFKLIGGDSTTWMSAVYMTANVLTTAGFREAVEIRDNSAQVFTVVLLFIGAGALVYATSVITAFVVEGQLSQGFRRRRMRRAIDRMHGHYIVCGAGSTGWAVLTELVKTERPVIAIEQNLDHLHRIETEYPAVPVLHADFTDDQVLLQAGIARAAGIVICTTIDKDLLVTTITARQLNPKLRIVARAANERAAARLRQASADAVVSPAMIGGMRMASELVRPGVVSFLDTMLRDTNKNLRIEEVVIRAGSPFIGRTLGELNTHARTNCLLLATRAPAGDYTYNPPDEQRIVDGMLLIVMGEPHDARSLSDTSAGSAMAQAPTPALR